VTSIRDKAAAVESARREERDIARQEAERKAAESAQTKQQGVEAKNKKSTVCLVQ
jgi:hypothetical protein